MKRTNGPIPEFVLIQEDADDKGNNLEIQLEKLLILCLFSGGNQKNQIRDGNKRFYFIGRLNCYPQTIVGGTQHRS